MGKKKLSLSKHEAKIICEENGIPLHGNITFASKNKSNLANCYWANPNITFLSDIWWLLLNDSINRKLYIFKIPANAIPRKQVVTRKDKPELMDIRIRYEANSFEDSRSEMKLKFKWLEKTISY